MTLEGIVKLVFGIVLIAEMIVLLAVCLLRIGNILCGLEEKEDGYE